MARITKIMFYFFLVTVLAGCKSPEPKPIWEDIKIGDLAPPNQPTAQTMIKTINFNIEIIDIPRDNAFVLEAIQKILPSVQFEYSSQKAFAENSFWVGFGDGDLWPQIANALDQVKAKKIETISLLLTDGQYEDIAISELPRRTDLYYLSEQGTMEMVRLENGQIAMRVKATKAAGARGVCNFQAMPVYPLPGDTATQLSYGHKMGEVLFTPMFFEIDMTPRTFILLTPNKVVKGKSTPAGYFFDRDKYLRIYLIICEKVPD